MSVTKVGDLVWVRVQGHPWWPGQVMDPKKATNEKVVRDRKADHTLISFFGDDSYGWFPKGRDIIPFHKNYDAKSRQAASKRDKKFNRACAEGMEVHGRRLGNTPGTKFRPHDFLHPGWSDDSDEEAAEDRYDDLRPLPASAEKLQDCSAQQALLWLQCVACNPVERPKMSPVKIDGAKRQLFSLAKSQNIKLQEAALKRRKSPSPASDLADTPAADAAADDDTAEPTGEEEEPQGVSSGKQKKKTAKLKKQRSGGEEAVDGVGKAGPMKRKRRGDAEAKSNKPEKKKPRRKPALAEAKHEAVESEAVNEEEEVEDKEEVKSEDEEEDSKRETMPDEDADEAHPETTEAGADEADEPLSDSDAEPEAEPDHKQKKGKKKLPEEHDKTPRPPARPNRGAGTGTYRGAGPRKLKADLPGVLAMLRDMALDPDNYWWGNRAAEGAAWLSFRELIFSYSSYNKEGEVGEVTAAALSAKDVRWAKVRAVKEMKERAPTKQYGVPAEPGADLGIEYRYTHYISKLPDTRQAFDDQLSLFYSQRGAVLSPPSITHSLLDCYTVFSSVAQKGGFEGVSGTRQWSTVAREWRADMGGLEGSRIKKAYIKFLLAFEQHISQEAVVEVRKKKGTGMKRSGLSGSMDPEDRTVKKAKKRKRAVDGAEVGPAAASSGPAEPSRDESEEEEGNAAQGAEDSEPEGSEVSYGSDDPQEPEESEAESDAEDNKRLAAAADAAKLKKLHKEARRDSKFVRKKLQRQVEPGEGGKGTTQKLQAELKEVDPFETEDALVRRDSNQGDTPTRGKRQVVDARAMAARPGQAEERINKANLERRTQLRMQIQARKDPSNLEARSKASQSWRSGMEDMLGSASAPQRLEEQKEDARTLIVLQFRENYPLPSRAVVQNIMTQYGPLHSQDDVWFSKLKFVVYARFKYEQHALAAYKALDLKASWLFNMSEGSVKRITLTIPFSKEKKFAGANPNPTPASAPAAAPLQPAPYVPPARPIANPTQPVFPASGLPQPTDPRRAAAAKSANPTPASQVGQYPSQIGTGAGANTSGSGQYLGAAAGLTAAGASGQYARALPSDPRADPRTDPRSKSAFRPAGGYAGGGASTSAPYRPPPPPSQGGLPPPGALPPTGGLPPFAGAYPPSRHQWVPPVGGLPPPSYLAGLPGPQGYAMHAPMAQRPLQPPPPINPLISSAVSQHGNSSSPASMHAATHTPTPESSIMHPSGAHRTVAASAVPAAAAAAAALSTSPVPRRPVQAAAPGYAQSPSPPAAAAAAAPSAAGPDVLDILSILRNAGMQNPLADLQASLGAASAAPAAANSYPGSQQAGVAPAGDAQAEGAKGLGNIGDSGLADAGPTLAGDDSSNAPDVSNNLLALLSQLAPAGQ